MATLFVSFLAFANPERKVPTPGNGMFNRKLTDPQGYVIRGAFNQAPSNQTLSGILNPSLQTFELGGYGFGSWGGCVQKYLIDD